MSLNFSNERPCLYPRTNALGVALSHWRNAVVARYSHPDHLLDIACGDNRLVRRLGYGIGIDIRNYSEVDRVVPGFAELPFPNRSFDTVTIVAALNYFPEPIRVLSEVNRVLKEEGRLLITLLHQPVSAVWHQFFDTDTPRPAFSEQELSSFLSQAGLYIADKRRFMLGLNCLYIVRKR